MSEAAWAAAEAEAAARRRDEAVTSEEFDRAQAELDLAIDVARIAAADELASKAQADADWFFDGVLDAMDDDDLDRAAKLFALHDEARQAGYVHEDRAYAVRERVFSGTPLIGRRSSCHAASRILAPGVVRQPRSRPRERRERHVARSTSGTNSGGDLDPPPAREGGGEGQSGRSDSARWGWAA